MLLKVYDKKKLDLKCLPMFLNIIKNVLTVKQLSYFLHVYYSLYYYYNYRVFYDQETQQQR